MTKATEPGLEEPCHVNESVGCQAVGNEKRKLDPSQVKAAMALGPPGANVAVVGVGTKVHPPACVHVNVAVRVFAWALGAPTATSTPVRMIPKDFRILPIPLDTSE